MRRRSRGAIGRTRRVLLAASIAVCLLLGANVAGALAATYRVTSNADTGGTCSPAPAPCTLRQAVNSATSGSDVINVPADHYLLGSALPITANVTINGAAANTTSIDANNGSRVFDVSGSVSSLTLSGVTLTHGATSGLNNGGGLEWSASGGATLNLTGSIVTNNAAGRGNGGGVSLTGGTGATTVNVTDSAFRSNAAGAANGAGGGDGGGLYVLGGTGATTINVTRSTFSSNSAPAGDGGALYFLGGSGDNALKIRASTFSGNFVTSGGDGGAIWYSSGSGTNTATILNSTFAGNRIDSGAGGALFLLSITGTLTNDTIAANVITSGNGGENPGIFGASGLTANNTIIADTSSSGDCDNPVASSDHSLQSGPAGCGLDRTGNPMLGPLANNGGPTQTMRPQTGSAAIDAGDSAKCPTTDQRGKPRPDNGESTCDIGAFEVQDDKSPPTIKITTPANGAHYKKGQKINANYSCSDPDGASDVKTCKGPVANGKPIDTSAAGQHSFTVHASDKAGNTSSKTVHYTVDKPKPKPRPKHHCGHDQDVLPGGHCQKHDDDDDDVDVRNVASLR